MAVINKIREKSGWAVGAIAVGLLIFMVLGDLLGPQSRLFGRGDTIVGEIAGQEITIQEFDETLEGVKRNFINQNQGRQPNENEMGPLREQAWNQLIFKIAFQKEFDRLGLAVTEEELVDMVQGNHIHPAIQQSFTDPQTGQFDRSKVIEYLRNLNKAPAEQQAMWVNFEESLRPDRMRMKFDNLIKQSAYVTTQEAKNFNEEQNAQASVKYLYIPYFTLSDSAFKVTDDQLKAYLDKNKNKYKAEPSRSVEYVTVSVAPSAADKDAAKEEIQSLAKQFQNSTNDSLFVAANSETPFNPSYVNIGQLPEKLKSVSLTKGTVVGPFEENGTYTMYKVSDVKEGGTPSIRASHILFKPASDTPEAKAEAKKKAEEVLGQIKRGASFEEMARQYGSDGTASQGGDLGWFNQGNMVPEFDKAVFNAKSTGLLPNLVETSFGYHIVKVTEPKTTRSYQIATVTRNIGSSDDTRDAAFRKVDELAGTSKNAEEFNANIAKDKSFVKAEAKNLRQNDRFVNNLNARELVRWTFNKDTKVGEVSPVFEVDDQFVVAVLTGKTEKGEQNIEARREELTAAVRNELKANAIKEKLANAKGSLEEIAAKYGPEAQVRTASNVTFGSANIEGAGIEPVAVGKIFALQPGKRTEAIEGQGGVIMAELQQITPAAPVTDIAGVKKQLEGMRMARLDNAVYEAIKAEAEIKDNRVKFF
ncbi:peptidylprolyl isomerase [Adhaeribacter soli]|uniref:Periplasmic chaperone PpiD n=1 Tax=Adhaeribacter soli TaxID=2607655 RepID=A0A5N1J4G4_9BACT|nr:peptidylprolyl isomerase [Adhaeribacter soli]KAA9339969.1 peptidylprolyl isomerase [Adhaeribacter soli]